MVREAGMGYVAEDETTWLLSLRKLLDRAELGMRLGERGRAWFRYHRTRDTWAPRLVAFLEDRASCPNRGGLEGVGNTLAKTSDDDREREGLSGTENLGRPR